MALPQQTMPPSPALMHSTSVPHVSHWNHFPSWLDTIYLRSFDWLRTGSLLLLHRLVAAAKAAFAALGDDHLRAALRALISLAHLVRHWLSVLPEGYSGGRHSDKPSGEYSASVKRASTQPYSAVIVPVMLLLCTWQRKKCSPAERLTSTVRLQGALQVSVSAIGSSPFRFRENDAHKY